MGHEGSHFCVRLYFVFHLSEDIGKKEHYEHTSKQCYKDFTLALQCWCGRVQISETPVICVNQIQSLSPCSSISIPISYISKNLTDVLKSKAETWKYKAKPEGENDGKNKNFT